MWQATAYEETHQVCFLELWQDILHFKAIVGKCLIIVASYEISECKLFGTFTCDILSFGRSKFTLKRMLHVKLLKNHALPGKLHA